MNQQFAIGTLTRLSKLISKAIERLSLDLSGLVVYTEAATGYFSITAPLAAKAGAEKVFALAQPWKGLSADEVSCETKKLADYLNVGKRINLITKRSITDFSEADIVTNLGFVRPIDKDIVMALKQTAVISYMREPWEIRLQDVDLSACRERGIPVFATNESHPDVGVFDTCGLLAAKLLFEAGIEINGTFIIIVSSDRFGPVIKDCLTKLGAGVCLLTSPSHESFLETLPKADALVIADFTAKKMLLGQGGLIEPAVLAQHAPGLPVIAFAGGVDGISTSNAGLRCIPEEGCAVGRMGRTLAYIGPSPVINLHAAGLKVGSAAAYGIRQGLAGNALTEYVRSTSPSAEMLMI